jgi:hypothetical protein
MKYKKRKIKKNFNNRLIYFFVTLGILVALAFGVYAFGTFNPSSFGHSLGELAAPSGCTAGQLLQYNGTSFVCGSGAGGSACPSGMTASYSYVNAGEDGSVAYGPVDSGMGCGSSSNPTFANSESAGADTCNGDKSLNAWYTPSTSIWTGSACVESASFYCRDIVLFRDPISHCYFYNYRDFNCKRRATLTCVE